MAGLRCKLCCQARESRLVSISLIIPSLRLVSMDPVQSDLKRLGVKPSDLTKYNIHMPPFPGLGLYYYLGGEVILEITIFCLQYSTFNLFTFDFNLQVLENF